MKYQDRAHHSLIVSMESMKDFSRTNSEERLIWLEEMRRFLGEALSPLIKKNWGKPFFLSRGKKTRKKHRGE